MRTFFLHSCAVLLLSAPCAVAAEPQQSLDLRRAVPPDAFMAVYGKHNPERDFQREYYQEVWDTVRETQIIERAVKIVTARIPDEDLQKAKSVFEEFREAAAPFDVEAILNCQEVVYAQEMKVPVAQHLLLMRLSPEAAAASVEGVKNLFGMVEKYTKGEAAVETTEEGGAELTILSFQHEMPVRPTVTHVGDVLLLSSSEEIARRSLKLLVGGEGESKFDDPRVKEALARLPEPEDSLVFYDGKRQFDEMRQMGAFIRQESGGDPDAERIAGLLDLLFDEVSVLDYEVTVEYTEGNHNLSAAYGKLQPGAEDKVLMKVFGSGQPFENWERWVPAEALSYSLSTGANLHPAYEWIVATVPEHFPEAQPLLERFEKWQSEVDVHVDRDILQAFSGECVSVSLPAANPSLLGGQDTVIALRCQKPERIRELLHRLVEYLGQHPAFKAQGIELAECEKLEGFEQLSAVLLTVFGVQPVIGFHDGWMIVGSNAQVVQKVLDTRAGRGETIADTDAFKRLNLKIEGPVYSISYSNLAESIRGFAKFLNQAGTVVQMVVGMAGAQADDESLQPVQEALGLLPSAAQIIAKFDFLETKISVTQGGEEPGSYLRRTVTVVRPKSSD